MERQIMKDAQNSACLEMIDQRLALFEGRQQDVEHVIRLFTVCWNDGQPDVAVFRPGRQMGSVKLPNTLSLRLNLVAGFQLRQQVRCQNIGWQIAGTQIRPGIFVHLASKETASVGSFFAQNLGASNVLWVVDQQCSPFAAGNILGFMKALGRHAAKCAQGLALVFPEQTMRIVFYHWDSVARGNSQDGVHFAANARVMNHHNSFGARCNQGFQRLLIEIQGVWANICKDDPRPAQGKSVRRRNKGERWNNDFIARRDVQEQGRHFQRMSAGSRQQYFGNAQNLLQYGMAALRKRAIAGGMTSRNRLADVSQFGACQTGTVKRN